MKIGEVARASGVSVDTVRFYERVGVLAAPERTGSGYRLYEPSTIERIRLTRELQAIGFTLSDVVDALAAHDAGGATCESERWRLDAVLERVDAKLAELTALRGRIVARGPRARAARAYSCAASASVRSISLRTIDSPSSTPIPGLASSWSAFAPSARWTVTCAERSVSLHEPPTCATTPCAWQSSTASTEVHASRGRAP